MLAEFGYKPYAGVDVEAFSLWKRLGTDRKNWKRRGWLYISSGTNNITTFCNGSPLKYVPELKFKDVHRYLCRQVQDEVKGLQGR